MVKKRIWNSSSFIAWVVSCVVLTYVTFNLFRWKDGNILAYDVAYYYLFLPSAIVYGDIGKMEFYPAKIREYDIGYRQPTYELYPQKTGRLTNKYAIGVAVCQLPFFLAAHAYCLSIRSYPADGFSMPYKVSIVFATLCWALAGLFVLRKLLLLYYGEGTTAVTLLLVAFATNLYFYTVDHVGMSHPFSFALCAVLCYATAQAYQTRRTKYFVAIGLSLGLIAIVRPVNVLMAVIPLCWPLAAAGEGRLQFFRRHRAAIMAAVTICVAVLFIQLGYLKYTSGEWLHFSYEEEGFMFPHSEMWNGLFSYRKGWFVYTPLAVCMILGIVPMVKQQRNLAILIGGFVLAYWYVIFSWHQWWYGGSFGARPMVDVYAVLALPLAAVVHSIIAGSKQFVRVLAVALGVSFITLNIFQSYQLINEVTRWDKTTRSFYWRSFGRLELSDEEKKLP